MPPAPLAKPTFSRLDIVGTLSIGCALASGLLLGTGGHLLLASIAAAVFFGAGITLFTRAPGALARSGAFNRVSLSADPLRPGEEVRVQLVLEPRGAVTIRSGRLVMRCVECAWMRQGDHHVEQLRTVAEVSWPMELPKQLDRPYTHPMRVKALEQAAPRAAGAHWTELAVELDLERWPMISEVTQLVVPPPVAPREAEPGPRLVDSDDELWANVYRVQLRPGELVRGEIKIGPVKKGPHASALMVRLTWVAHGTGDNRSTPVVEQRLADGPFTEDATLYFALALPDDAPLTYRGEMIDIDWYVEAELLDAPGLTAQSHAAFVVG